MNIIQNKYINYLCFPSIGDNPIITEAKADLTCWLVSATSPLTTGKIDVMIMESTAFEVCAAFGSFNKAPEATGGQRLRQKSHTLLAAAALTSASVSRNNDWKVGTKSIRVISGPTAFCN